MRKQIKRILAVLLVAVMVSGSAPLAGFVGFDLPGFGELFATKAEAAAYNGTCGDNLTWTLDSETGELVISGTGDMTEWLSYSSVPWYSNRTRIISVTIGDGVTSIGDWAFYNYYTKLASITIGKDVSGIGYKAFENDGTLTGITVDPANATYSSDEYGALFNKDKTELIKFPSAKTSYEIPDSVTKIGDYAFYRCSSLTSVTIPDSVINIGNSAFAYCKALTSVTIPDSVISIGNSAFNHCDQCTSFTIGNGVKSIGGSAFSYSPAFTSITIPDSVTSIGGSAFYECDGLTSITIPDSVTTLGSGAFTLCSALTSVTLGNGISEIKSQTFFSCYALTNVTIGNNVKSIGENAFYYCSKLSGIVIPDSVTDIEEGAFFHCNSMTSATIGNGVKTIGPRAFDYCQKLTSITIPDNVTKIGGSAFYHCDALESVTIGNGVTKILNSTFSVCTSLSEVTLGSNITSIGDSAFSSCDGLTEITIPDGVTTIGKSAFNSCDGLISVTIPDSVTSIGESVFSSCISLTGITVEPDNTAYSSDEYGVLFNKDKTELIQYPIANTRTSYEIPDGVTSIGKSAFRKCSTLTSVIIPSGVTSIGESAFYGCSALTSAAIPDGVTSIGEKAFYECTKLASINIPDSVTEIGEAAFKGCSKATSLTIGKGITSIGVSVFESCCRVESITIPECITSIGDEAFKNCNTITSITIPGTVTSIGYQAFYNCYNLTSVTISDGVTSIGDEAFYGCNPLESITISDGVTSIGKDAFLSTAIYDDTANWENGVLYIGNHLIKAETTLSEAYSIKEGTKTIGGSAFSECTELFEVTIPDGTVSISDSAFYGCTSLYSVTTPDSITNIGEYAFYNCNNLQEFSMPESVACIGDYAFYECTYIDDIVIPDGVTVIGSYVFYGCDILTNITIPDSVTSIGDFAFCDCYNLRNITIPDGVTSIGVRAFYECSKISDLIIPGSVTSVGDSAFAYCSSLTSITIPESLTTISQRAFSYCTGLTSVSIPESVTAIEFSAFEYCTKLTSITIPDNLTSIGGSAFIGCKRLTDIKLHDNIKFFGFQAFHNTGAYNDLTNWDNGVFYLENYLIASVDSMSEDCSVKEGTTMIADDAFLWNDTIRSITIPDSVKSINGSSFFDCDALTTVTMGSSVTNIDGSAFEYCDALADVYYHGTEADWNAITIAEDNEPFINATRHYIYSYSLSYDANGGVGTIDKQTGDVTYTIGSTVPVRSGYNFLGWSTDSNAASAEYAAGDSITLNEDTVLYAVWSKITYTLSFDTNGGVGTIDKQTGDVAYTIGSTVPVRSGYNFLGWSTNSSATSAEYVPGDSITLTADTTLYAVWAKKSYSLVKSDIFSFINSRSNFKTGTYTMTDDDFIKLTNYVSNMYNATAAQIFINRLQVARSNTWGGSCFGMSMSVILNKTGQIDFVNNFDPAAADMYGVSKPYQNEAVQSAINYYQISQRVNAFRTTTYTVDKGNFSTGLEKLVNTVKAGNMTLIIYSWPEGCHAIVLVGYEEAEGGGHNLIAYDNRYGSKYINVYIDEEYTTCTVNGTEEAYYVEFNTDFSIFDKIDIDGPNNDMVFETTALSSESIGTEIGVKLNGDISVKNAAGETLTIKDGVFDGNMKVFSSYMIVNSSADGTPVPGTLMLEVEDSDSFTFESTADEITASLTTEECYAEVTATADKVIISEDEGIYATGNDVEFSGWLSLNNDMGDVISFDGQGNSDVNLLYGNNDEIIIEGATDECTVTVYSNLVDVDKVTFNSDYETLKVIEKAGNIAITASGKNDGVFDVKVAEIINTEPTVAVANPSTTEISYGDSIVLHANTDVDLPIGYYIVWTADNSNFSYTVSDDGKTCTITPSSSGETTFTATVYDANGNVVSKDDRTMTSKAGFFQKIIAFFKRLFGMTKVIPEAFKDIF